jgi:hypothetical protein
MCRGEYFFNLKKKKSHRRLGNIAWGLISSFVVLKVVHYYDDKVTVDKINRV